MPEESVGRGVVNVGAGAEDVSAMVGEDRGGIMSACSEGAVLAKDAGAPDAPVDLPPHDSNGRAKRCRVACRSSSFWVRARSEAKSARN